jgi:hypothetical protein
MAALEAHKRAKKPIDGRQIKPLTWRLVPLSPRYVASSCSPSTDTINDIITGGMEKLCSLPLRRRRV